MKEKTMCRRKRRRKRNERGRNGLKEKNEEKE